MGKVKIAVALLLIACVLSGCQELESMRKAVIDSQRPSNGVQAMEFKSKFEEGRDAEYRGDIPTATEKYEYLAGLGCCYGQYGLANLLLKHYTDYDEYAAELLIDCVVKRANNALDFYSNTDMDSAFSVAAMSKLAEIARDEDIKVRDGNVEIPIAELLYKKMYEVASRNDVITWAETNKENDASAKIFEDIIAEVGLAIREYRKFNFIKDIGWEKISKAFITGYDVDRNPFGKGESRLPQSRPYSVTRFVKVDNADAKLQYEFEVKLLGNNAYGAGEKFRSAKERDLRREFLAMHPSFSVNDVGISFPSWSQSGSTITGSVVAKALKFEVVGREYNKITGKGKVGVRLGDNDVVAAEKLAIENIEAIATRHNILNVAGDLPPKGAQYTVIKSGTTEDGLFEIEFKCE